MYSKIIRDALIITIMKSKHFIKNPLSFIVIAAFPLIFNFAILWLSGYKSLVNAFSGTMILMIAFSGLTIVAQGINSERKNRTLSLYITSPIHPLSYGLGVALSSLLQSILNIILTTAIYILFTGKIRNIVGVNIFLLIPVFILTWLICITNGLLLVSLIRNWQIINIITSFLPFLYMFLSPIYYSYKYLPYYLYLLVYMVPLTPCVIAMKSILDNDLSNIWINLSVAIFYVLLFLLLTIKKVQWREK